MPTLARHDSANPEPPDAVGRFLPRWQARVIRQGNVSVVEFLDKPWYTQPARKLGARRRILHRVLRALRLA